MADEFEEAEKQLESPNPFEGLTDSEKIDIILDQQVQTGNLMNYIIGVIKQAEFAIANSPMSKMMGQRRG